MGCNTWSFVYIRETTEYYLNLILYPPLENLTTRITIDSRMRASFRSNDVLSHPKLSSVVVNFSIFFISPLFLKKSKVPYIQKKLMYGKFLLHNECRRSLSKFKSGSFFCNKCNFVAQPGDVIWEPTQWSKINNLIQKLSAFSETQLDFIQQISWIFKHFIVFS